MARCGGCGTGRCECTVVGGTTPTTITTVEGDGSAVDPSLVTTEVRVAGGDNLLTVGDDGLYVECEGVRGCLTAGDGIAFDPETGEIAARPSGDPDNQLEIGGDGGLYVPPSAGEGDPVAVGCGLTGDGTEGSPLAAVVGEWPFDCDPDAAGLVYCDADGALRGEPRPIYDYIQTNLNEMFPDNPLVPTTTSAGGEDVVIRSLDIPNPDDCREARVIIESEVDVGFVLPPGGRAGHFVAGDEMYRFQNTGDVTLTDIHTQTTKVVGNFVIPPGGTYTFDLRVGLGMGLNGTTYNRIQTFIRAMIFVL